MAAVRPQTTYVKQQHGRRLLRNPWFWISIVLAMLLAGAVVWGLEMRSDRDAAQADVAELQGQIDAAKEAGGTAAGEYKAAYEDLEQELGTTQSDLAESEQAVEDAEKAADAAEQDAAAATQETEAAQTEADKANAEAAEAEADLEAAKSKATVAKECAKAYTPALGSLLQSPDPAAQAAAVKEELQGIVDGCKAELSGE